MQPHALADVERIGSITYLSFVASVMHTARKWTIVAKTLPQHAIWHLQLPSEFVIGFRNNNIPSVGFRKGTDDYGDYGDYGVIHVFFYKNRVYNNVKLRFGQNLRTS